MALKAKNALGIVFFPAYDWAISPSHPEREERLLYTHDQVMEEGVFDIDGIKELVPKVAEEADVNRVHICVPDVSTRVTHSHMVSAGGAIRAAEAVMDKEVDKAFAVVRPPGHHAHRVVWGDRGFCIINNEAIMIEHIRKKYGKMRIAIVDTDCHHGDGSQDIFWHDRDTLFISLHQDGRTLYPGSGFTDELGGPNAYGYTLNIPLPPGTTDEGYLYVVDNVVLPVLSEFKPDIVINSAGQDNHYTDPITNMAISAQGYAELNRRINPDIAVLEGGYSIEGALPYVNVGIMLAMAGLDFSGIREPDYSEEMSRQSRLEMDYIKRVCDEVYKKWSQRDVLRERYLQGKKVVERQRRIYYDTDNIMEYQREKTWVCSCSGLTCIESHAEGDKVYAVIIPRDACDRCYEAGIQEWEKARKVYGAVYLQDKRNDVFRKAIA
ncbi:histone deacetylase family protein [Caldanaerobius polysaccharolyticus]|uniref:histone deacetylase family protein n=1 Tax=Caldanaerobius polysaccharolyticus TaxID=44256 RepID=UPI000555EB75|nr:histone deacetylase [Caldanaerobius polysaccharolyticus]